MKIAKAQINTDSLSHVDSLCSSKYNITSGRDNLMLQDVSCKYYYLLFMNQKYEGKYEAVFLIAAQIA